MEITKLTVFPLIYHPYLSGIKCELIARGKVFEELSGNHYKAYQLLSKRNLIQSISEHLQIRVRIGTHRSKHPPPAIPYPPSIVDGSNEKELAQKEEMSQQGFAD